jgi:TRAP-type mannitol/chloroaromatic compound transport system permease large subunit
MIPPSIVLIIFGLSANVSIGELFTASFVPGLMLACLYAAYVLLTGFFRPDKAPALPQLEAVPLAEKLRLLRGLILPLIVVVFVLGSIYGGIASVTEASAIGVVGVVLSTVLRGEFSFGCSPTRRCRRCAPAA